MTLYVPIFHSVSSPYGQNGRATLGVGHCATMVALNKTLTVDTTTSQQETDLI